MLFFILLLLFSSPAKSSANRAIQKYIMIMLKLMTTTRVFNHVPILIREVVINHSKH